MNESLSFSSSPKHEVEQPSPVTTPDRALTRYFTFGQDHVHRIPGLTVDKDIVLEITDSDPRSIMVRWFGLEWSMEYDNCPELVHFPRGVIKFPL